MIGRLVSNTVSETSMFRSLRNPRYRIYWCGQLISLTGTWMQTVAMMWISYSLTHSAFVLGVVGFAGSMPVLLFSLVGGMLADRFSRRRILLITQTTEMLLAIVLAALIGSGQLTVTWLIILSVLQGIVNSFDLPARQPFVYDLVQGADVFNAVSLSSLTFNTTRLVGPALGAVLMYFFGEVSCFVFNALSFFAANTAVYYLKPLAHQVSAAKKKEVQPTIRAGLKVSFGTPSIRSLLILTAFTGFFAFQLTMLLPLFIDTIFHKDGGFWLSILQSTIGAGSVTGSLALAKWGKAELAHTIIAASSFAAAVVLLMWALASSFAVVCILQVLVGLLFSLQLNSTNSQIQILAPEGFRGRVAGIYTLILIGSVPFGNLIISYLAEILGARIALGTCATACLFAATYYIFYGKGTSHE